MKASITNSYIIKLALPISLAMIIPLINDLTNNYFLGQIGIQELAVNAVSGIFYLVLSMVGMGLANGIQVKMSRKAANLDYSGIAKIFVNGIMLTIMLALVLMMLTLWFAPLIFSLSMHSTEHAYWATNFLYIRVWGLPFLMLTQLINAFFIATSKSRFLMYGSLITTVANVLFDYLFIFGFGKMKAMGLEGAALASTCAEIIGFLLMYALFFMKKMHVKFPIKRQFEIDVPLIQRMLKISAPLIVQYFFSIGGWLIFFIFVEHLGERELAASQILRSLFRIVSVTTWAFSATCNSMVSNIIGQGRQNEVMPLVHKISKISFLSTLVLCIIMLAGGRYYLSLFTTDTGLVALALPSLRVIILGTLVMSWATVAFNGVVGTGKTVMNLLIEITCVFTYLIYCYIFIQRLRLPLQYAWMSEFVYWTSLLIISYSYLRSGRWMSRRI